MKKYIILAPIIIALLLIGNNYYQTRQFKEQKISGAEPTTSQPYNSVDPAAAPDKKTSQLMLAVIDIGGFDCPSCPVIAETALEDTKGVVDVETTETGAGSRVLYDPSMVSMDDLRKALSKRGMYTIDRVISEQPTNISKLN